MIAILSVASALALSMSQIPAMTRVMKVTTIPPETVQTSASYDAASRKLTISCDIASRGLCRFKVVDGARTKQFMLRPRTRLVIAGVSNRARTCAVGRNPGPACDPEPVSG